jgi:hypothetical protein
METEIEIGSGFTVCIPDQIVHHARASGLTMIAFPTIGVSWYARTHSWRAYLYIHGRQKHLGYFKDKAAAIRRVQNATSESATA